MCFLLAGHSLLLSTVLPLSCCSVGLSPPPGVPAPRWAVLEHKAGGDTPSYATFKAIKLPRGRSAARTSPLPELSPLFFFLPQVYYPALALPSLLWREQPLLPRPSVPSAGLTTDYIFNKDVFCR